MASEESHNKPSGEHSNTELFASAKLVADAAQSTFRNEGHKVDKEKAADAAGDLLDAAGKYGKLDDQKGIGQYVDKAADYLHKYQTTPSESKPEESKDGHDAHSGGGGGAAGGGGGLGGDFAKVAGGFFK